MGMGPWGWTVARGRARGYAVLSLAYTATAINLPAETFVFHPLDFSFPARGS